MSWQMLEVFKVLVLVVLAIGLHKLIRGFGKNYTADIFQSTPQIGTSFLILADVAYYLIFTAYVLFNVQFTPGENWTATVGAAQLQDTVSSIAGICLIIGLLHGVNVFVLPFIGSILALRKRLMEYQPKPEDRG